MWDWVNSVLCLVITSYCAGAPEVRGDVVNVTLLPPAGNGYMIQAEVADTPAERERGLMFRQELPFGRGMVFFWEQPQVVKLWMRNTLIPLDAIFMKAHTVVHVEQGLLPHDETPRGPDFPVDSALEVPIGTVKQLGVQPGWRVQYTEVFNQVKPGSRPKLRDQLGPVVPPARE